MVPETDSAILVFNFTYETAGIHSAKAKSESEKLKLLPGPQPSP